MPINKKIGMGFMVGGWIVAFVSLKLLDFVDEKHFHIPILVTTACILLVQPLGLVIMGKGLDGRPGMMKRLIAFVGRISAIFSALAVFFPIFPMNLVFALIFGLSGAVVCTIIAVFGGTFFAFILGILDCFETLIYLRKQNKE